MTTSTKIQLSPQEMELACNSDWILTKHIIIKKVFEMFGDCNEMMKKAAEPFNYLCPGNSRCGNGKISKGENYRQLPYVILDYPAFFGKKSIFAIRIMFWWGNFFSVTLHLSGIHKEKYTAAGTCILSFLQKNDFYICLNNDEWQHSFEPSNYVPALNIGPAGFQQMLNKDFFKISKKMPITEWQQATEFITKTFVEIMELLQLSYPVGKTDLSPVFPKAGSGL